MGTSDDIHRIAFRTCPLCEAGCGLEIAVGRGVDGTERVVRIRGDRDDVFSHGYLCPKGTTLGHLHDDPDRLRRPMVKRDGVHVEVDWDEAWHEIEERLTAIVRDHGREAVGVYLGNPSAHNLSAMMYNRTLLGALGTRRRFSASTVDQAPRQVASGFVFGTPVSVPVPDLDHTDFLVLVGANPYASNGSLCTAPDFPGRIERIQERCGTVVVLDPRRSRTAEQADRWLAVRPGTDALVLAAMVATLAEEGLVAPGDHVAEVLTGLDEVLAALTPFTPERVARVVGVDAEEIRCLARDLARASSGSVYGRIGTTTSGLGGLGGFGTLTSWLVDVVNIATGNLDRRGGAMFPLPVAGGASTRGSRERGKGFATGRGHTVVRRRPEVMGEYPAAAMAEEITEAGEERIRAFVTVAGNPVLSTPHSRQLDDALGSLDLMVSVDMYLNETTRHADVILPPPSQLQRSHYDLLLLQFAVRNTANYSEPVLGLDEGQPDEWEILARLAAIAAGLGVDADLAALDDSTLRTMVERSVVDETSPFHGREVEAVMDELGTEPGPDRMLDFMLRTGPYRTSLAALRENPHGLDFGALEPRLPEILRTPSGMIELAHPALMADLGRLTAAWAAADEQLAGGQMTLVGRRHLRSNNSWMHNINVLVKGRPRCTLQVHPDDAARLGLTDGSDAEVASRVGRLVAPVEVTDAVRPGVVSLPHGWGHGVAGTRMGVAAGVAGVNSNLLSDHDDLDPLSGTSVLNGIMVTVAPAG